MRILIASLFLLFLLKGNLVTAQVKPVTSVTTVPAAVGNTTAKQTTLNSYTSTTPLNYVRVYEPQRPFTLESDVSSGSRTVEEVQRTTQYFDGIGRPLQTVAWQQSTDKKDMTSAAYYDELGRSPYGFLPFVAATTSVSAAADGNFKYDPFAQLNTFGSAQYPGETFFYGRTRYEASPLNRAEASFAPGNSWAGSEVTGGATAEHAMKTSYGVNEANEVKQWTITNTALTYDGTNEITASLNIPVTAAYYASGTLYRTLITDEQNNRVVEYKDIEGKVVLKKVQNTTSAILNSHTDWLCTYYIYDDFNMLRFVISPKATQWLAGAGGWSLTTTEGAKVTDELCYRYEYDAKQRLIAKKVPGAKWVYMVYDNKDRPVFMQDGNMRAKSWWMTTMYDVLNRPVLTGITSRTAALTHTALISNMVNLAYTTNTTVSAMSVNADPTYSLSPAVTFIAQTKTHFDSYAWTTVIYNTDFTSRLNSSTTNVYGESVPASASTLVKGTVTGTEVKVMEDPGDLNTGAWQSTVNFYDDKGKTLQTNAVNYKGGADLSTNLYNWAGLVVSNLTEHTNPEAVNTDVSVATRRVATDYAYDHTGRVTEIKKRLFKKGSGNNLVQIQTLRTVKNSYDAMGQLTTKSLGNTRTANTTYTYNSIAPIDNLAYSYNIRGWLKGINTAAVNGAARMQQNIQATDSWFSMELNYDWGFGTSQYNGNIAGMKWRAKGDDKTRAYGYSYDAANRLQVADFSQYSSSGWNVSLMDFSLDNVGYDYNGNITALKQKGMKLGVKGLIDDLSYTYSQNSSTNTNKLTTVMDAQNDQTSVLGDFKYDPAGKQSSDYSYDANGNMIKDNNKGITISYNYLNLPFIIVFVRPQQTNNIYYIYDASGNKIEKNTFDYKDINGSSYTTVATKTTYLNGFIYQKVTTQPYTNGLFGTAITNGPILQYFGHEEGRVREMADGSGNAYYNFDYYEKDHLGNVRVMLTDELKQDIYPAATLEGNINATGSPNAINLEQNYYSIITANVVPQSSATGITAYLNNNGIANPNPSSNTTANSASLYKLQASGTAGVTGLSTLLKVMAGDNLNILGKSYYFTNTTGGASGKSLVVDDIVTALLATPTGLVAGKGATMATLGSGATGIPLSAVNKTTTNTDVVPLAYINYILLDERFQYVSSGASRVGTKNTVKDHLLDLQNIAVKINGYIFIYCSNQSPVAVFFDNLQLVHNHGPLLQEAHYSPWGLKLQAISSDAMGIGGATNRYLYNGKEQQAGEFSDGTGLEMYDYGARMLDPQLGVWHSIDPLADMSRRFSPFVYGADNPVRFIDPDGMAFMGYGGADDADEAVADGSATRTSGADVSSDRNKMVNYLRVENKNTGLVTDVIEGYADDDAKEEYKDIGDGGGAGAAFRTKDEAAFAWALESANNLTRGENERAGTIYSETNGKNKQTFSYNGSYKGISDHKSDFHKELIPSGATIEGFIHTHTTSEFSFSRHTNIEDTNQYLDENFMNQWDNTDCYLLNASGYLLVNRGAVPIYSNPGNRSKDFVLVSGLISKQYNFRLNNWQDAYNQPLKAGEVPITIKNYIK